MKRYIDITPNQLHNRLLKRNLPPHIITIIKEQVALKKKLRNTARVENKIRLRRWAKFIEPLSKEIKSVQVNLKYHEQHNPELYMFFVDYLGLLLETRGNLNLLKIRREATPHNHDKTKKRWADYISPELRTDYTQRYHSIPYASKNSNNRRELFK